MNEEIVRQQSTVTDICEIGTIVFSLIDVRVYICV